MQITLSKAILAKLDVELSRDWSKGEAWNKHRWIARPRMGDTPRFHRVASPEIFEKCLPGGFSCYSDRNCHFLIRSCRNASETKAWGSATFTCKPDSLRRNFACLRTSSSSTTSCFSDSAHVRLAQNQDPCSTLPPSRRSRRMKHGSRKRDIV